MFRTMSILIEYPLLAIFPSIAFVGLYRVTRRPFVLVLGLAWLLYGIYEYATQERILCSGECNIRIDLIVIYPVLAVASPAKRLRRSQLCHLRGEGGCGAVARTATKLLNIEPGIEADTK